MTITDVRPDTTATAQTDPEGAVTPTPYVPENPHRAGVLASGWIAIAACAGVVTSIERHAEHVQVAFLGLGAAVFLFLFFLIRHELHLEVPPLPPKDRP